MQLAACGAVVAADVAAFVVGDDCAAPWLKWAAGKRPSRWLTIVESIECASFSGLLLVRLGAFYCAIKLC